MLSVCEQIVLIWSCRRGKPDPQMLRTFIEDVAPRVRERVATARASRTADPLRRRSTVKDTHEEPCAGEA
jgi:hypothetical protein